jgi:hypothetical protein
LTASILRGGGTATYNRAMDANRALDARAIVWRIIAPADPQLADRIDALLAAYERTASAPSALGARKQPPHRVEETIEPTDNRQLTTDKS